MKKHFQISAPTLKHVGFEDMKAPCRPIYQKEELTLLPQMLVTNMHTLSVPGISTTLLDTSLCRQHGFHNVIAQTDLPRAATRGEGGHNSPGAESAWVAK